LRFVTTSCKTANVHGKAEGNAEEDKFKDVASASDGRVNFPFKLIVFHTNWFKNVV
jgi:hypothetical protein